MSLLQGCRVKIWSAIVAIILSMLASTNAQAAPPLPCNFRFQSAVVTNCFSANGMNFTGLANMLSGNLSAGLPPGFNYTTFKHMLCSESFQDKAITCVLNEISKQNASQCSSTDKNTIITQGGQLLSYVEGICREPCIQVALQSVIQCYSAVGVKMDNVISPNTTIIKDKYSMFGNNEIAFDLFCKHQEKLFTCLRPISSSCSAITRTLYTIGIDLRAVEQAATYLCGKKQHYISSLGCSIETSPDTNKCSQNATGNMQSAFIGRYQTGSIAPSVYQDSLCGTKLTQMACEQTVMQKVCGADNMAKRMGVECSMLPEPCRDATAAQIQFSNLCDSVTLPPPSSGLPPPSSGLPGALPAAGDTPNTLSEKPKPNTGTSSSVMSALLLLASITTVFLA